MKVMVWFFLIIPIVFNSNCLTYRTITLEPSDPNLQILYINGDKYYKYSDDDFIIEIKNHLNTWNSFKFEISIKNISSKNITISEDNFYCLYFKNNGEPYHLTFEDYWLYDHQWIMNSNQKNDPNNFHIEPYMYFNDQKHRMGPDYDLYLRKNTILNNTSLIGILEFPYNIKVSKVILVLTRNNISYKFPFILNAKTVIQ